MSDVQTSTSTTVLAIAAMLGSLVVAEVGQGAHAGRRMGCHPAAEAHLRTAIRLMTIACDKPIHVSSHLARVAVRQISRARRHVRSPDARAELVSAKRALERFVYGHCPPPFHRTIKCTRLALELERAMCACGRPACKGGCDGPLTFRHGVNRPGHGAPRYGRPPGLGVRASRDYRGRDLEHEYDGGYARPGFRQPADPYGVRRDTRTFHGLWNAMAAWLR